LTPVIDEPGLYILTITNADNGCSDFSEVIVNQDITAPIVDAGEPFVLPCFEETVNLQGTAISTSPNVAINWSSTNGNFSSGTSTLSPAIVSGGTYTLEVTNLDNSCSASDSVLVTEDVPHDLQAIVQSPPCFGDPGSIQITDIEGGTPPYLFTINGGESFGTESQFSELPPGEYTILGQDANGCETEPIEIVIQQPEEILLVVKSQVELLLGDTYQVKAQTNIPEVEIAFIAWSNSETLSCDDCLDPLASPLETTEYQLTIEDSSGCPATARIKIYVDERPVVFIPNAFSPNGDGANDKFMIFAREEAVRKVNRFLVFDRWGEKVFEYDNFQPNDPASGWDGWYRGQVMNPQVFAWFAEIEFINGEVILFEGDVTLTR
jgi:gliding motility-associated-like protein